MRTNRSPPFRLMCGWWPRCGGRESNACLFFYQCSTVGGPYDFRLEILNRSISAVKLDVLAFYDGEKLLDWRDGDWEGVRKQDAPGGWKQPRRLPDGRDGVSIPVPMVELPWKELQAAFRLRVLDEEGREECFHDAFSNAPQVRDEKADGFAALG